MPNRYVREAAIDSRAVNSLSWVAEAFWRRLINKVDDFGRFSADVQILRGELFKRKLDQVREADLPRLLAECEKAGLLFVYQIDGKPFLVMNQWERGRAKRSQYPEPPPEVCLRLQTFVYTGEQMSPTPTPTPIPIPAPVTEPPLSSSKPVLEKGFGEKPFVGEPGSCRDVPTEDEAVALTMTAGLDDAFTRYVYRTWATQNGRNGNGLIVEFLPYVVNRWKNEQVEWRNGTHKGNRKNNAPRPEATLELKRL